MDRLLSKLRLASAARAVLRGWMQLGLFTQFLFGAAVMLSAMHFVATAAERRFAEQYLFESAMALEQAVARGILAPFVADIDPVAGIAPERAEALDAAIADHVADGYFDMVKLWTLDGRLVYWSHGAPGAHVTASDAIDRAAAGETVVSRDEPDDFEHRGGATNGAEVFEVYLPLRNAEGEVIAVGEIYCRFDVVLSRVQAAAQEMARGRLFVLVAGLAGLGALVAISHARQRRSGDELRRRMCADLRDGPLQLLSMAALYSSQANAGVAGVRQVRALNEQALEALRNIISDPVEHQGLSDTLTQRCEAAISRFERDTGRTVWRKRLDTVDGLSSGQVDSAVRMLNDILALAQTVWPATRIAVSLLNHEQRFTIETVCAASAPGEKLAGETGECVVQQLSALQDVARVNGCRLDWAIAGSACTITARFAAHAATATIPEKAG